MNTSFQRTSGSDEWYTPKALLDALGPFDLDPCAPVKPLWPTARVMYNKEEDGLSLSWQVGGVEYGSTLHTPSRLLHSSAKSWLGTAMGYACYLAAQVTRYSRISCFLTQMRYCFSGRESNFLGRMALKGQAVDATRFCLPLERRMCKPCYKAALKES